MNFEGGFAQFLAMLVALAGAPLLVGWVNVCRAWLQNRSAPPLTQQFRLLHKLFWKESVVAHDATPIYRVAPYVVFGCMLLAAMIIPTLSTDLPLAPAADAIALVGLFALARLFISLAAMDIGTSFGTMGARREMLIGFLAEPAFLMVLFTASLLSSSTSLATIVTTLAHREFTILPSLAFAGVAFTMVSLAENARVPIDNPAARLRAAGARGKARRGRVPARADRDDPREDAHLPGARIPRHRVPARRAGAPRPPAAGRVR